MTGFAFLAYGRATHRRLAVLGAATAFAVPALLGAPALAVEDPGTSPTASASATPSPTPAPAASQIGGPRMSERGMVFGGGPVAPPEVAGASYVVADADTGQILAAKDPHGGYRPASTLKTLLALTMLPRLDANATYKADEADTLVEGTRVGLVNRQTYPIDLLWYGLILRSGNDAANALAKAGAEGDLAKAVRMMNAEARRLQALDTTAVNPSGLDEDGQYSSAYDLALFGRAAVARGDMRKYMRTVKVKYPGDHTITSTPKNSKSFDVYTGNRLILHGYDGAIGVKNGYTTLARNTLIAAAERDGRTYIATIMRSPGSIHTDAERLLDWAFANAGTVVPVGALVDPVSAAVVTPEDGAAALPEPATAVAADIEPVPAESVNASGEGADVVPAPASDRSSATAAIATAGALLACCAAALVGRRRRRA